MSRLTSRRRQAGFTLMELVITIVLLGILAVVGSSMLSDGVRTAQFVDSGQSSAAQTRYAIDRLAREIREVQFDSAGGTFSITSSMPVSGTVSNMVFTKSSLTGSTTVTVTINKDASGNVTLGYSTPAVTSVLISGVTGFEIKYMDIANAATTSKANVRFVQISLAVKDSLSGQTVSDVTRIQLRNG